MPRTRSRRPRQLVLRLPTWGGARPGGGRRPTGLRAGVSHGARPALAARYPVHVTLRVRPHVYQLRSRRCFRVVGAALLAARDRHGMRICQYSVQGNHLHLVVEARDAAALARGMKGLSVRIARGLNRLMGTRGPVLADRYHARILRTPREVRGALAYVLGNHRHHARGWSSPPPDLGPWPDPDPARNGGAPSAVDPYSSGRTFDGWRSDPREGPTRSGPPPIPTAPPHTWLLATGWRRHGLIDPGRAPAPAPRSPRRAPSPPGPQDRSPPGRGPPAAPRRRARGP